MKRGDLMSIDINDFAFTLDQRRQLAKLAESLGKSPTEVLDQLLKQHPVPLRAGSGEGKLRTLYDAFAEDGSIGMVKGDALDMSTNPKYMEGFGRSER
jgi:hypothetical protein